VGNELNTWKVKGVRAWAAEWSNGDPATAVQLFDEANARQALDPVFWFTTMVAFTHVADAERRVSSARDLLAAATPQPRSAFFAAIASYAAAVQHSTEEGLEWIDRALAVADAVGCPSAIAHAHQTRGLALRRSDPAGCCAASRLAIDIASTIHPEHLMVDAGLNGLALATAPEGAIGEALRSSRDAIASAASFRNVTTLAVALNAAAVALTRAGDPDTAAALLDAVRSRGHRVWRTAQHAVSRGPEKRAARGPSAAESPSLLDAADRALGAIDAALRLEFNC
jgi:hypothetical protein